MKGKIFTTLLCFSLIMVWSCSNDDDDDWRDNPELDKDARSMYITDNYRFRNGTDSIVAKYSSYYNEFVCTYYIKDNNIFKQDKKKVLKDVYFSMENGSKSFAGKSNTNGEEVKLFYTLDKDNNLTIKNLPNAPEPITLTPTVKKYTYKDPKINGGWYTTSVVDSLVLAFEDKALKEYHFVKGGTEILNYYSFGKFDPTITTTYWEGRLETQESYFNVKAEEEYKNEYHYYSINGDILTIKWAKPINKTIKYKRLK